MRSRSELRLGLRIGLRTDPESFDCGEAGLVRVDRVAVFFCTVMAANRLNRYAVP
jgi:hypothetical protein